MYEVIEDGVKYLVVQFYEYEGITISYQHDGHLHRINGPAVIGSDGRKYWYFKGNKHRICGPAILNATGTLEYWYHGVRVHASDLDDFNKQIRLNSIS